MKILSDFWISCLLVSLLMPAMQAALISVSNSALKNQRQERRCIAVKSLTEPLLITLTRLTLLHQNSFLIWIPDGAACDN